VVLFKKEKEVVELIIQHTDKVEECLSTALKTLRAYLKDDLVSAKKLSRQTDGIETEADLIRHRIRDKLYSGAYLPMLREDIYKLVESLDKVANAGEACCDFFLGQRPMFPEELKVPFLAAVEESLSIITPLKKAVLCFLDDACSSEDVRENAKTVGVIESNVDKIEWDLTRAIFTSSLECARKIHLKLCLNSIADISDEAESAADQLELVNLKAMI
jgi:predicted phosphate transport protein (TIGR00153 family)